MSGKEQIKVGQLRTSYINGNESDRLYGLGSGKNSLSLTQIPGLQNGLPLKKALLFVGIFVVWSAPLSWAGLKFSSFGHVGLIIYFVPPAALIWAAGRHIGESSLTMGQQVGFMLRRFFREGTRYRGNRIVVGRTRRRVKVTMYTAPGATSYTPRRTLNP